MCSQVSFHTSYGFADQATKNIYQRAHDEFYNLYKDFDEKYNFTEVKALVPYFYENFF